MKLSKPIIAFTSLFLLTSCSSLDSLKKKNIHGNNFNSELSRNYLKFADSEAKQFDWIDSNHFAKKGLAASKGVNTGPEDLSKWDLTPEHRNELTHARNELTAALTNTNKNTFPKEAADAQAYFDCWVEEQEENWQKNSIVYCKKHYQDAINKLHHVIRAVEKPIPAPIVKFEPKIEAQVETKYVVHFDFDKSNIAKSEESILKNMVTAYNKLNNKIRLDGYADDTGSDEYNDKLSLRRAESVKNYLKSLGVEEGQFELNYHGKHHLVVKTPHGVKERMNRRVEIKID